MGEQRKFNIQSIPQWIALVATLMGGVSGYARLSQRVETLESTVTQEQNAAQKIAESDRVFRETTIDKLSRIEASVNILIQERKREQPH